MENNQNQFLNWDDVIENDSAFVLLPEGDYPFTVTEFSRGNFQPKRADSKVPACDCAELKLEVIDPTTGAATTIEDKLFMLRKFEWKLCQFFTAIGQRKRGEQLKMNWATVLGAKGRIRIKVDKYTDKDGNIRDKNVIDSYLEPVEPPKASWTPGKF